MKILKFLINRATLTTLFLLIELAMLVLAIVYISEYFWSFYIILEIISVLVILHVASNDQDPTTKFPWLIIVLLLPPFGTLIYLMFSSNAPRKRQLKQLKKISEQIALTLPSNQVEEKLLKQKNEVAFAQSFYINKQNGIPVYNNSKVTYFPTGESFFEKYLEEIKKAKHFIFLEYFIIQDGFLWNKIYSVLKEKAKAGVEIKIMYDDIGSIYKLPYRYNKKISGKNIECIKFNKYRPIVSAIHNNRDHRKMTIIDNAVAFTGGLNIADEYINKIEVFGHWKDCGVMIKGDAVMPMTLEFLKLYFLQTGNVQQTEQYFKKHNITKNENSGFVQPFFDAPYPIYKDRVGENTYINIINQAKHYLYITTPYLIIDYNFLSAIKLAKKRGVDVKIITPHIPDKKIIFMQTQATYKQLLLEGIEIYEYLPGFIHSKILISDDEFAIVGTFNIDYRSFVHHFENGIWLYDAPCIKNIKQDFEKTVKQSKKIEIGNYNFGILKKLFSEIISIFSALM